MGLRCDASRTAATKASAQGVLTVTMPKSPQAKSNITEVLSREKDLLPFGRWAFYFEFCNFACEGPTR
jgi:hypothetical protein